jgi:hypothetical protein
VGEERGGKEMDGYPLTSSTQVVVVKKQKATGTLAGMVDYPLTEEQKK